MLHQRLALYNPHTKVEKHANPVDTITTRSASACGLVYYCTRVRNNAKVGRNSYDTRTEQSTLFQRKKETRSHKVFSKTPEAIHWKKQPLQTTKYGNNARLWSTTRDSHPRVPCLANWADLGSAENIAQGGFKSLKKFLVCLCRTCKCPTAMSEQPN